MAAPPPDDVQPPLGAWVVTCHPALYDLAGLHAEGYRGVANWRVQHPDRADRMQPGDRIVLWMAAAPEGPPPGVWGIGVVTSPVERLSLDPSPRFAWMDHSGQGHSAHVVHVDLRLLDQPIPAGDVTGDPRFAAAELVADPDGPDPRVLSPSEWEVVAERLPAGWPDPATWADLDPNDLPDPGVEPLDARFEPVTAAELSALTGVDAEVVERVLVNQYDELEACYAAGDLIVTDLSYYCRDDELLGQAEEIEASIDADTDGAVDVLVEALEELAGDRLVLVPNDLPETPGFLDDTGASEAEAELVLDAYWDLVLDRPARLDPFWLTADADTVTPDDQS